MAGIMKKMMPISKSMSGNEFIDFDPEISIALEYTGSPVNHSNLPRILPVDVDHIPTAKVAASPGFLHNLSLPVAEPVVRKNFRASKDVSLGNWVNDLKNLKGSKSNDHVDNVGFESARNLKGFEKVGDLKGFDETERIKGVIGKKGGRNLYEEGLIKCCDGIESSGSLGFSCSTRDHSHELSESSDMLETPFDCNEIEELTDQPGSTARVFSGLACYEGEEESNDERLECRRKKKPVVNFDHDSDEMLGLGDSVYSYESQFRERPVAQRPAKRGLCYHCHRGNRFTEKEVCLVCSAKYCGSCIIRVMGSMPEGRKCLTCIGYAVDDSKRQMLGKCSWVLKGLLKGEEVKRIMNAEVTCAANQLPPHCISVNGRPLCMEELLELRSCPNPPRNLEPGDYWYDRVSGFWGKEGHKPCQIISPHLNVREVMKREASNGNANLLINGREITKAELWMLQSAGVQCDGNLSFWLQADGTYTEEGMNLIKGNIWTRRRTKVLCSVLSLPTPESPNPRRQPNNAYERGDSNYLEPRAFCKVLLVGDDQSGTSTIYKQAKVLYDPFSDEERQNIKSMIQSNLYGYLGALLEGREIFEEESLSRRRKGKFTDQAGSSDSSSEIKAKTDYGISLKLKKFSDWLIDVMVSGNMDIIFPAATREYAPYVEELWKDAAMQATYSRRDELGLPRAATYFLDRAVEIAKVDYEPSDTDILYAEGISSSDGLRSMEFSITETANDAYKDPADQPDHVARYQLIRVHAKSLGENCKWLEMFEDVGIILFCVSLTEYDEYGFDRNGELTNKMLLTKRLFESIVTHPSSAETNFLLVLNKYDLLEEMIEKVPLTRCEWFKDFNPVYSRHQSSRRHGNTIAPLAQRAFHYIAVKFKELFKSLTKRKLYVCPVIALDSDTVGSALRYASEIVKWEDDKLGFSLHETSSESIDVDTISYSNS